MNKGSKVVFQNDVYTVVSDEGDSLVVKRAGSRTPISVPKSQVRKVFQEGRSEFDTSTRLNG